MKNIAPLFFFMLFISGYKESVDKNNTPKDLLLNFINPFIGTGEHGHTYFKETISSIILQICHNKNWDQISQCYTFNLIVLNLLISDFKKTKTKILVFEKTKSNISKGKIFNIQAESVSDKNFYIQSATLSGPEFNQTSISHQQLTHGGILHFVMGSEPNKKWGLTNTNLK
tara:strand:- start:260173 stop:260685 length:513 start_codon:yes stop_codon:yes gene_type:complete